MADGGAPASTLRRVALADITPGPNARPRKPGALSWQDAVSLPAPASLPMASLPFDVSHVANVRLVDGCACMMQAPAVRPVDNAAAPSPLSLIFGECRLWAALLSGATHIEVSVHDVDEQAAAIMHRVENSAHAPLPPLAEAEELAALQQMSKALADPLALARAVGRPVEEVRRRLALLRCCAPVREALAADPTLEPLAVFWSRHEEAEQAGAWERAQYLLKLTGSKLTPAMRALFADLPIASARWDLAEHDPAWNAKTGPNGPWRPCVGCPDRSDATGSLFADDSAATCLKPKCWDAKSAAHDARILARARERSVPVLEGVEARKVLSGDTVEESSGYVDLDAGSPVVGPDRRRLTWRMILPPTVDQGIGPDAPIGIDAAIVDRDGHTRELVRVSRVAGLTRQGNLAHPERAKVLAEWSKAALASQTVVRPPEPAPLPKAKAKGGSGDVRAKMAAEQRDMEIDVALGVIAEKGEKHGSETDLFASLLIRVVSDDARVRVAERRELDGVPRAALLAFVRERVDVGDLEAIDGLTFELLAAHDAGDEGEDRAFDVASRWAGVGAKGSKKTSKPSDPAPPVRASAPATPSSKISCDCRPPGGRRGPCLKTCASKAAPGVRDEAASLPVAPARAALAAAIATICAGGGRKRMQALAGLKTSVPSSSPEERQAAIDLAIERGRLVEKPGGKLVAKAST